MSIFLIPDAKNGHTSLTNERFFGAQKKKKKLTECHQVMSTAAVLHLRSPLRSGAEWNRPFVTQSRGEGKNCAQRGPATIKGKNVVLMYYVGVTTGRGGSGAGSVI